MDALSLSVVSSSLQQFYEYSFSNVLSRSVVFPTLCDPVDCSLAGSSVCGIFQARIVKWAAICSSLPESGIGPASPALATNSLSLSHLGYYEINPSTQIFLNLVFYSPPSHYFY